MLGFEVPNVVGLVILVIFVIVYVLVEVLGVEAWGPRFFSNIKKWWDDRRG
jgi:hypothetical protein